MHIAIAGTMTVFSQGATIARHHGGSGCGRAAARPDGPIILGGVVEQAATPLDEVPERDGDQ